MAYIPGFEYDIFISYAHVDNALLTGQEKGWIQEFYENLDVLLAQRFGRSGLVKIWWDSKKLDGSKVFDVSIEEGIKKSAVMICLLSPGYQASEYCNKELELFHQKAQQEGAGLRINDRTRILNVQLNNISYQEWPKELEGATGFSFHDAEDRDDFGDRLEAGSAGFRDSLHELRDALWELLSEFQKEFKEDTDIADETGGSSEAFKMV